MLHSKPMIESHNYFTNEVEQWYVRHNYFIVLYHRLHVSTYIQVIFIHSFTGKSIKRWDPNMYSILWTYL